MASTFPVSPQWGRYGVDTFGVHVKCKALYIIRTVARLNGLGEGTGEGTGSEKPVVALRIEQAFGTLAVDAKRLGCRVAGVFCQGRILQSAGVLDFKGLGVRQPLSLRHVANSDILARGGPCLAYLNVQSLVLFRNSQRFFRDFSDARRVVGFSGYYLLWVCF